MGVKVGMSPVFFFVFFFEGSILEMTLSWGLKFCMHMTGFSMIFLNQIGEGHQEPLVEVLWNDPEVH